MRAAGIDGAILTGESLDGDYWIGTVPDLSNFYVVNYGSKYGDDPDAGGQRLLQALRGEVRQEGRRLLRAPRLLRRAGLGDGGEQGRLARRRQGRGGARHLRQGAAGDRPDHLHAGTAHPDDPADGDHRRDRTASSPRSAASRWRNSRSSDSMLARTTRTVARPWSFAARRDVTVRFGGLVALDDVSLALGKGEVLGLIGPNGAGKTTLVNVLSGFQRPHAGAIGRRRRPMHAPAAARLCAGAASSAPSRRCGCFKGLTVSENVEVGYVARGLGRGGRAGGRAKCSMNSGSAARRDRPAAALSYGEERRVGLARALALEPRFLLLDEPAAGLAPAEAEELATSDRRRSAKLRLRRAGDRAQHGARHEPLRSHPRARRRPDHRCRHAGRDPRPTCEGARAPISARSSCANEQARRRRASSMLPASSSATAPIAAVRGVDLEVGEGEIVAIVGPNGAGKTSLLSAIAGIVRPAAGAIAPRRRDRSPAHARRRGPARHRAGAGGAAHLRQPDRDGKPAARRDDPARRMRRSAPTSTAVFATFPILGERRDQPAGQLSGGEQQQLAIARALLSRPRLLMLDEPSLGLAPTIVDQVYGCCASIRDDGVTILLVEQNAARAFALADRAYVMSGGVFALGGHSGGARAARPALRRRLFRGRRWPKAGAA